MQHIFTAIIFQIKLVISLVPFLSIVTPNYNYAKFLPALLESIRDQNFENYEHIIVDDGSTDDSVAVIEKYILQSNDKIRLIKQKNMGQTFAINRALVEANRELDH